MSTQLADIPILANSAVEHEQIFDVVLSNYEGKSRKNRQHAAAVFKMISQEHPEKLVSIIPNLLEGLDRPEAQTRWCILETLENLVSLAPDQCSQAFDGAEDALFDEKDGFLREKAFSFLCRLGSLSSELSEKVWPLLDEAIQCNHGNPEYASMLAALHQFSQSQLSESVKDGIKSRLEFDAKNSNGAFSKRAQQILASLE